MPEFPTTSTGQSIALVVLLAIAVATDVGSRRIPNRLVLTGIAIALGAHFLLMALGYSSLSGPHWWSPLAGLAAGFALLLPLYLLRAMGAGDVKLLAMAGAFIGFPAILTATLYTLAAGGILALLLMLGRGVAAQTLTNLSFMLTNLVVRASTGQGAKIEPLQKTAARMPYALAIAMGTAAALLFPLRF